MEKLLLAVIVPAHNEEAHLDACLAALRLATACPELHGEPVALIVALDSCSDRSEAIALRHGAEVIAVQARNVGAARAAGAMRALSLGARWLAFTDADTLVAPDWLSTQLDLNCDAVCGTVAITDWGLHCEATRRHHDALYTDADGHRHIHGANLAVSARAYVDAGGFPPLVSSEDVALVAALQQRGARIAWSARPRVTTSARRDHRAPAGFGATLLRMAHELSRESAE
ncbi:glycosyltransferase [Ideonella azotifigens]|uniref:Glycosyltransferase n=1 Tax=Ideonella azotifigens TaxID=513160 RepID=A0ABP3V334_9BURK